MGQTIDLGFNPAEPRDRFGKWIKGSGAIRSALSSTEPGSTFRSVRTSKVGSPHERGNDITYTKRLNGDWESNEFEGAVVSLDTLISRSLHRPKGFLQTPEDQRIVRDQEQNARDRALLRKRAKMDAAAKRSIAKRLASVLNAAMADPGNNPYDPFRMPHQKGEKIYRPDQNPGNPFREFSTPPTGQEIDLDWTQWDKERKQGKHPDNRPNHHKGQRPNTAPARGNKRAQTEIEAFKRSAGLKGKDAKLRGKALEVLRRRAQKEGHYRAKAILAAARGNVARANKIEAARQAVYKAKKATADLSVVDLSTLDAAARRALPATAFVFPQSRRYPIHDRAHAENALARSKGKPEHAAVVAAVRRKYPDLPYFKK